MVAIVIVSVSSCYYFRMHLMATSMELTANDWHMLHTTNPPYRNIFIPYCLHIALTYFRYHHSQLPYAYSSNSIATVPSDQRALLGRKYLTTRHLTAHLHHPAYCFHLELHGYIWLSLFSFTLRIWLIIFTRHLPLGDFAASFAFSAASRHI